MVRILIFILFSGGGCNFSHKSDQFKSESKEISTDTIRDPINNPPCSLNLESTPVKIKSISFSKCTGNAVVIVLIDSTHSIKDIKILHIVMMQNKKVIFESSENLDNNDPQLKAITESINAVIKNAKVVCVKDNYSTTSLRIPLKLLIE